MTTTTSDQIHDLGSRWVDAELAADVQALDTLATDDFRLVGPFGFVLDKQQWLDRYRSGDLATTVLTWHDVDLREYATPSSPSARSHRKPPTRARRPMATSASRTCSCALATSG